MLQANKMNKLLIICGPTSAGKTTLAINLAKKFNGEIVSADSRQVYKGMDIGTGKELPKGAKIKYPWFYKWGYYEIKGIKVWGYDLIDPKNEFSVAAYLKFAKKALAVIWKKRKLPILVGGTGLYIKAVVDGIQTISIPKNVSLRKSLSDKTVGELFEILAQLDPIKAASLNSSDSKNPRRLIRAIEIATRRLEVGRRADSEVENEIFSTLFVGLSAPKKFLNQKIEKRIDRWIKGGIEKEIRDLVKKHIPWSTQSMSSLGYGEWKDFFENKKSREEIVNLWKSKEKDYIKRQMTWFKKDKRINWFDFSKPDFAKKVEFMVKKWYSSGRND